MSACTVYIKLNADWFEISDCVCSRLCQWTGEDWSPCQIQKLPGISRHSRKHSHEECQGKDGYVWRNKQVLFVEKRKQKGKVNFKITCKFYDLIEIKCKREYHNKLKRRKINSLS